MVTMNVGGRLFELEQSVIGECQLLSCAVDGWGWGRQLVLPCDEDGHLFLDRDPVLFEHVLAYLRHGRLPEDGFVDRHALLTEARFLRALGLVDRLLADLSIDMDEEIDVNCGGRYFTTTRRVLAEGPPQCGIRGCSLKPSVLARMFGGSQPLRRGRDGAVFIDSDPDTFAVMLQFLKTGELVLPEGFLKTQALWEDCAAFGLVDMLEAGMRPGGPFEGRSGKVRRCWTHNCDEAFVAKYGILPGYVA